MTNQKTPVQGGATEEQTRALAIREAAEYLNRILRSGLVSKADVLGDLEAVAYRMEKGMNARGNVRLSKPVLASSATEEQIEAAARVLYEANPIKYTLTCHAEKIGEDKPWEVLNDATKGSFRGLASAALEAALSASASAHPADERHDVEEREADTARALIVAIAEELTPGRRDKDLVIAARELRLKVERCEAESEDHAATVTGDREKLISDAAQMLDAWLRDKYDVNRNVPRIPFIHELADALAAPVEVDREHLRKAIAPVLFNSMNYPEPHRMLGKSFGKLESALLDALEVALRGEG